MRHKNKVILTNKSIDSNIPNVSFIESLKQYIWNSFDAKASTIEIIFDRNGLNGFSSIKVLDNGEGIHFDTLQKSFTPFSDSPKSNKSSNSEVKGEKGKGRFYFRNFARNAEWITTYEKNHQYYTYNISISSIEKDSYENTEPELVKEKKITGTEVVFTNIDSISEYILTEHANIKDEIAKEFGWLLLLNKEKNFKIIFDSEIIQYENLIEEYTTELKELENEKFNVTYIQWKKKISEKSFSYFIGSDKKIKSKKLTKYNEKGTHFYHSLYIQSDFFDDFVFNEDKKFNKQLTLNLYEKNLIFTEITGILNEFLYIKHTKYLKENAVNTLIKEYRMKDILPKFKDNEYDKTREKDLVNVIKEIYIIQPSIFNKLNNSQAKTIVGLLNLLLDSDSREDILNLLSSYLTMSENDKDDLRNILKKTSFSKITQTIKMFYHRLDVIERLKILVFDLGKFTTEREHIQKIIEENYWLLGEEYNLITADENFDQALYKYLSFLDEKHLEKNVTKISQRRPDILMCSNYNTLGSNAVINEESIIIELKRPDVKIGATEYRQIEDYKDQILEEPKFNSSSRKWKFYIIGKEIESSVKKKYDSSKINIRCLTETDGKTYEIYAMTWDDIFTNFKIRYKHILNKIGLKDSDILGEIKIDESLTKKEQVKEISSKIINIKK
jgi:hypothetical protein